MAIETVGRAISVAPSIGRAASIGPSLGGMSVPSFEGGLAIRSMANPFRESKGPSFVENRGPSYLNPTVDVMKNPFMKAKVQPPVKTLPMVAEAVPLRAQVRIQTKVMEIPIPKIMEAKLPHLIPRPNLAPYLEVRHWPVLKIGAKSQINFNQATENRIINLEERLTQPIVEVKTTEVVEKKKKGQAQNVRDEKIVKKIKLIEAFKITQRRKNLLRGAIKKAAERGRFTGRDIRRFLIWRDEDLSPVVRNRGIDGTIKLTDQALESDTREYSSPADAEKSVVGLVEKYKPIEEGEGKPVTIGEYKQVKEGKEAEKEENNSPAEIRSERLVRKSEFLNGGNAVTTVSEEKVESNGPSLKDFPGWAEVFELEKAA